VFGAPRGEFGEFFPARHGGVLHEDRWGGNSDCGQGQKHFAIKEAPARRKVGWRHGRWTNLDLIIQSQAVERIKEGTATTR